jgi:predicted kinase
MLVVFSGRPASGKTTIARLLARRLEAVYLRIDTMDAPLQAAFGRDIEDLSYRLAYGVAADNLALERTVVADRVNDVNITRDAWRDAAQRAGSSFGEVEIVCSDAQEHRRRVETRIADVPGLILPSWQEIDALTPDPWLRDHIVIDTAGRSPEDRLVELMARLPCANEQRAGKGS